MSSIEGPGAAGGGGGGGVTIHADLTGLAADDHLQYLNQTRGDSRYPLTTSGSVLLTLTGGTTAPQVSCSWIKQGRIVTLWVPGITNYTSNSAAMTATGLPVELRPSASFSIYCSVTNNGSIVHGFANLYNNPSIVFYVGPGLGAFTASGLKGVPYGFMATYPTF